MRYLLFILVFLLPLPADATSGAIIQVSRRLRMSFSEALPPKDYYLDLGSRDGVKVGDVLEVYRMVPVLNLMAAGPQALFKIVFGEIKVYEVADTGSIARAAKERSVAELPAVDVPVMMIGDSVDVKTGLPFR